VYGALGLHGSGRLARNSQQDKSEGGLWVGALVAGTIGGLGDGLTAVRHSSLGPDSMRDVVLVVVSLLTALTVSLVAAGVVPWAAKLMGRSWPRSRWTGFCVAAVAWTALWVGTELPGWLALLAPLGFLSLPLLVHRQIGRPRMVASLLFLAMLAIVVADDRRPRTDGPLPETAGPDLVLVVIDGLRADQVDRVPTGDLAAMPRLQELARQGMRFTHALAPATTPAAAREAVLMGRPPWTPVEDRWARVLSANGVQTAIFGGAEVESLAAKAGFSIRDVDSGWPPGLTAGTPGRAWARLIDDVGSQRSTRRVVEAWKRWLTQVPDARPAVSVLHLTELSWPTVPAPPWDTAFEVAPSPVELPAEALGDCGPAARAAGLSTPRQLRTAYDGSAAAVDELLASVVATARARPRDAVVFIVGSRGTPMGENGLWLDASGDVSPSSARVPLVVVGPDVPVDSVLAATVSTADVVATVRAWHGLTAVSDARPLPGIVRGHRPREATWTVGVDASVASMTAGEYWLRRPDGQLLVWSDDAWIETESTPAVPVPVLTPVDRERSPCE